MHLLHPRARAGQSLAVFDRFSTDLTGHAWVGLADARLAVCYSGSRIVWPQSSSCAAWARAVLRNAMVRRMSCWHAAAHAASMSHACKHRQALLVIGAAVCMTRAAACCWLLQLRCVPSTGVQAGVAAAAVPSMHSWGPCPAECCLGKCGARKHVLAAVCCCLVTGESSNSSLHKTGLICLVVCHGQVSYHSAAAASCSHVHWLCFTRVAAVGAVSCQAAWLPWQQVYTSWLCARRVCE